MNKTTILEAAVGAIAIGLVVAKFRGLSPHCGRTRSGFGEAGDAAVAQERFRGLSPHSGLGLPQIWPFLPQHLLKNHRFRGLSPHSRGQSPRMQRVTNQKVLGLSVESSRTFSRMFGSV